MLTNRRLQKEKEDLDDVSNELELADEDDMIPYEYHKHTPIILCGFS